MGKIMTKDNRHIDYDEWDYFEDLESGIGIVVNHFRDGAEPVINVYVVPKDKVANNDWHSDMEMLGDNLDRIHAEREIQERELIECLVQPRPLESPDGNARGTSEE